MPAYLSAWVLPPMKKHEMSSECLSNWVTGIQIKHDLDMFILAGHREKHLVRLLKTQLADSSVCL